MKFSEQGVTTQVFAKVPGLSEFSSSKISHFVDPINITKIGRDINGGRLEPGDIVEWTITIKNIGLSKTVNIVVTDTLPSTLAYVPGSIAGTGADDSLAPTLTWRLGVLEVDESTTYSFKAAIADSVRNGDIIGNRAYVT